MTEHGRLPSGTPTFLFTDMEGSTHLVQQLGDRYPVLLETHRRLLREAWSAHRGVEVSTEGDSFFVAFEDAGDAVAAARAAQIALQHHDWAGDPPVRVRIGLHTGPVDVVADDYVGLAVHVAARVKSAGHGGQVLLSEATRLLVPDAAVLDHGEHRLKDIHAAVRIFQLLDDDLPAEFPPLRTLTVAPNNLPAAVDEFVGRAAELDTLRAALGEGRLVTLTGPGGSGKTRLALEVAALMASATPGGAWLVELAVTDDPSRVEALVAEALGVREQPGRTLRASLLDASRDRDLLLVLDNCEHVIDAAAEVVAALLAAAPRLRVLATSRERLGVRGERVVPLAPLAMTTDSADTSDAVRLFTARMRAVLPGFVLDDRAQQTVTALCQRLDGLPLAIELAAARTRAMSLDDLLHRIDDRFSVLASSERHAPSRQRTLEAVVAWSYDLLSEAEQRAFRRLSVIPDTFGLDAAESVCAGSDDEGPVVLDLLTALVDKSLVTVLHTEDGATRYQVLETLRAFGHDRLVAGGELAAARDALADWVLGLVAHLESVMRTSGQDEALRRTRVESANVQAALDHLLERRDDVGALRTISAVPVSSTRQRLALINELLARLPDAPSEVVGRALLTTANLHLEAGSYDDGLAAACRAEALFTSSGDARHATWARFFQLQPNWAQGALDRVDELCERLLVEFGEHGSTLGTAYVSWVASQRVADATRGIELANRSCAQFRQIGAEVGLAHALEGRALVSIRAGAVSQAIPSAAEALDLFVRSGNVGCTAHALEAAAACLAASGELAAAAELSGAAEAFREQTGHSHRPWELQGADGVRDALGDGSPEIDAARAAGRAHTLPSAAERALALLADLDAGSSAH